MLGTATNLTLGFSAQNARPVVWIKRCIEDILADLERCDGRRPSYPGGVTFSDVYHRRLPLFEQCSDYVFTVVQEDRDYDAISRDFCAFLRRVGVVAQPDAPRFRHATPSSAFVCLTLSSYDAKSQADVIAKAECGDMEQYLQKVCAGVDCAEVRLDMLQDCSRGELNWTDTFFCTV